MANLSTDFNFSDKQQYYSGKVRDVYTIDDLLVIVASDRISAFDHILPKPIPHKGQVLNQLAAYFLEATKDLVPNWLLEVPDPNVSIGHACEPFKIEMVVRGYLAGHSWREYKVGKRVICGVPMPEGMVEGQAFPEPIITPATKAEEGHDMDISAKDLVAEGFATQEQFDLLSKYALTLFKKGTEMAAERGLILVDTKYEFGLYNGEVVLIDEIHTPDSSRYYYAEGYAERLASGERQQQLSKEFVREWLMANGFQGLEGQEMPVMPDEFVDEVSSRYIHLYELLTGKNFELASYVDFKNRVEERVAGALEKIKP